MSNNIVKTKRRKKAKKQKSILPRCLCLLENIKALSWALKNNFEKRIKIALALSQSFYKNNFVAKAKPAESHTTKQSQGRKRRDKKEFELAIPLYFGWELAIRRINDWRKHIVGPFKKYWQYMTAVVVLICLVSTALFFSYRSKITYGATYTFIQTNWNTLSANSANHTSNQAGWTEYSATSTSITASSSIMIALTVSSTVQTDDGTTNTGFNLTGKSFSQSEVVGSGSGASVQLSPVSGQFGSGADGAITISASKNINSDTLATGRSCADGGDGVAYNVVALDDGSNMANLSTSISSGCLAAGDKVMLINLQGISTNYGNVGNHEILTINSILSGDTVFFTTAKTKCYGYTAGSPPCSNESNSYIGTQTTKQRVILQRIPQYTNVTIQSGGSLTASAWDGTKGGALAFYASGTVDAQTGGNISVNTMGYRVGPGAGESYNKINTTLTFPATNLGGGAYDTDGESYWNYGGGGYGSAGQTVGTAAGGSTYGSSDLSKLFLGSAGGSYGYGLSPGPNNGGGIIYVNADSITVSGSISNNGINAGGSTYAGGAGGSTYLSGNSLSLGTNLVTASGGTGSGNRGAGGDGRIYLKSNSITGTTNPTYASSSLPTIYESSGTFTSGAIDTGQNNSSWGNLSWTASGTGTITIKARSADNSSMTGATAWGSCGDIGNGNSLTSGSPNCVSNGHRYIQYQAALSTSDTSVTPSLDDVTIRYNYYPSGQTLTSSAFNSESAQNIMGGIAWDENSSLLSGAYVALQLRASSSSALLAATDWSAQLTSTSTNCSKASGTVTCSSGALPAWLTDASGDQWFQYRVYLTSDGANSPQVDNVNVSYVVNDPPQLQNVTAAEQSDGTVLISYDIRDPDTASSSPTNQYKVTPSFEYSTNGGSGWTAIVSDLSSGATSTKTVAEVAWNTYTATWNAKNVLNGTFTATFQIRVTVDDGEAAHNTASLASSNSTLDVKNPVPGATPMLVKATTTPATLVLNASDDSSLSMKISLASDLAGASWVSYNATSSITLATDPDTVYAQFMDAYGNTSSIQSVASAPTPGSMMIQDTSNIGTSEWRLFIAWSVTSLGAGSFGSYDVYRSTDGGANYSLLTAIANKNTNYYINTGLTASTTYYYKVSTVDSTGNASYFTSAIQAIANATQDAGEGGGGADATAPTISAVSATATTTQSITISWTTNELSNSTVGYCLSPCSDYTTEQGVASYVTSHSVILTGLTPATAYNFKVISTDPSANIASSTGYSFITNAGPSITANSVSVIEITNTTAKISWLTNTAASGYVVYATTSPPSGNEFGSNTKVTSRTVTLSGLSAGTKYYFYVKSQDEAGDWAYDYNDVGGTREYFTFTTSSDTTAMTITGVTASLITDTKAVISWTTDEVSTSVVDYGATSGSYTLASSSSALNASHAITLTGLSASTKYYYKATSADVNSNTASSTEYNFTTLEALSTESEVVARETAARNSVSSGGGGIIYIDRTDKQAPVISNINVTGIKSDQALVSWITNENANSFVEYGDSASYGRIFGDYNYITSHKILIKNLDAETTYHFRILGNDSSGNLANSNDYTFTTLSILKALEKNRKLGDNQTIEENQDAGNVLMNAIKKAMDIVSSMVSKVSLSALESTLLTQYDSIEKLANTIPPPLLSGEPRVVTTATTAAIAWKTDKEANSLVAISPESVFKIRAAARETYQQVVGNPTERTTDHLVTINDLEPDTLYHYQVRSKAAIGPLSQSDDYVFRTKTESLEISSYSIDKESAEKAIFKWVTNVESDSAVKYIPYRNNVLAVDEAAEASNKAMTVIHEVKVDNFEAGVIYNIEFLSKDAKGNLVTKAIKAFSTSEDDLPPMIYQVQSESAISPGKETKIQTIISWLTNEPSTSRVYYQKGFVPGEGQLAEKTLLDKNYTKKHIAVITKFGPGLIYTFQVESIDSGGNVSVSKPYTILAPRQKETVFQVIIKNLEQTFSWVNKLKM